MFPRFCRVSLNRQPRVDKLPPNWEVDHGEAGMRVSLARGDEETWGGTIADTSGASVFARASSSAPPALTGVPGSREVSEDVRRLEILYAADTEAGTFRSAVRELVKRQLRAQWLLFRDTEEGGDPPQGDVTGQDAQEDRRDGIEDYGQRATSGTASDDLPPPYTPHYLPPTPLLTSSDDHHTGLGLTLSPLPSVSSDVHGEVSVSDDERSGRFARGSRVDAACAHSLLELDFSPPSETAAYPQPMLISSMSDSGHGMLGPGERASPSTTRYALSETSAGSYPASLYILRRLEEDGLRTSSQLSVSSSSSSDASQDSEAHHSYNLPSGPLTPRSSTYSSPPVSAVSYLASSLSSYLPPSPVSPAGSSVDLSLEIARILAGHQEAGSR